MQIHADPVCQSLCFHMCGDPVDLEGFVFLISSIPSGYYTFFLPPLQYGPLSPEKGDLRETSSVELSVLRFYSLYNVWLESGY